jgi:flagellin-like hook-associated protein FlgL
VTYDISENPNVSGPFAGSATYPSNTEANIAVTAIPGLSIAIKGAPAVGDTMTITPRPSIFSVLDDAVNDIGNAVTSNAAMQAVGQALNNIDVGIARISSARGQAGDLLNRAERISSNQDKRSIQVEGDRSRAEDLDMIKGVSDFQNQQTGFQQRCSLTPRCRSSRSLTSSVSPTAASRLYGPIGARPRKPRLRSDLGATATLYGYAPVRPGPSRNDR